MHGTSRWFAGLAVTILCACRGVYAHPVTFNSTITYSTSQPSGGVASVAHWIAAGFDAANIGGSGVNADGGDNNGPANDDTTYVNNSSRQGQAFTTGSNSNGYDLSGITVRMAGYTNNVATGTNQTSWQVSSQAGGPFTVTIGRITGTSFAVRSMQFFMGGGVGNPGAGSSANGPGTYITFNLPFTVHLEPNTTYGFDLWVGNNSPNYFEWLGIGDTNSFGGGSAYVRNGWTITPLAGARVFMANLTASAAAPAPFPHPGTLHTQADLNRMKSKVASNEQPWKADFDILAASKYAQVNRSPAPVATIIRGPTGSNYTRTQEDAQSIYELALRWHITGDTNFAARAVYIANAWPPVCTGIGGDSNYALAAGICGYLFAIAGDLLSTYPGWAPADKQAYQEWMLQVFYTSSMDFLWRHNGTYLNGGNTHYRYNWDIDNMMSVQAIGVLCDDTAVYQQAIDYFKTGCGNGRIDRAAWYIHPDGGAQTEEMGRDQGHNVNGWSATALFCQIAWNNGDDLFSYDNNHVLRAIEYITKYNLWNEVPGVYHRNSDLAYTELIASGSRGNLPWLHELAYNHYVNVKGMAAPYSAQAVTLTRPETAPNASIHPSQIDFLGLGTLTYARDPISTGAPPSGVSGNWSENQITLNWFGSAYATNYLVQRATSIGGPFEDRTNRSDMTYSDTDVTNGGAYFYRVVANTPSGSLTSAVPLEMKQALMTQYTFDSTTNDAVGERPATLKGGATGVPGYATGKSGQALLLDGIDDYIQLPAGSGAYQDLTISAWIYWNGGGAWQRVFDFGTEIEKYMMMTVNAGSGQLRFEMTTSRATDGTITLTGPSMPVATWTHVAVTISGDSATLYMNGKPVASGAVTLDPLFTQPFCYIGRSLWNNDPLFSGRIDDFRIYNYPLSGSDLWSLWGGGGTNHAPVFASDWLTRAAATEDINYSNTVQTLAGSAADVDGGTLAYSKATGPSWLSVSTNGTLSGTPGNGDVGTNVFLVRVTDPTGASDDATLTLIVSNVNDAPSWPADPFTRPEVTRGLVYTGSVAGLGVDIDVGDSIAYSKIAGPSWLSVSSGGNLSGTPGAGDVGTNAFTIRASDGSGGYDDATMNIEVLPYSLRNSYTFESNLVDGVSSNNGMATGTLFYTNGTIGQAISLNGTDAFVTLSRPLSALVYKDITVAAWVNWRGGNAWQRIFDFGDSTTAYMFLTPRSGGNLTRFAILNGGTEQALEAAQLPSNQWVHVSVTLGGDTGILYINGAAVATNNAMTYNPSDFEPALNYIGDSQWSADPLYGGLVDDFRIYNYALTPAEILDASVSAVPVAPAGVSAIRGDRQVQLQWNSSFGAIGYRVKRSLVSGGPYTAITNTTTTSFLDSGLNNGVSYFYVVSATNRFGEGSNSVEVSAVPAPTPLPPVNVSAVGGYASVAVNWSPASGALGYVVRRATASGGPYLDRAYTANTSYLDTGVTNGVTYYYAIRARGDQGDSADSAEASASPLATGLPPPWKDQDVGAVSNAGSAAYNSGTFTLVASGADIWDTADQFHYVYQPVAGDCDARMRVMTLANNNAWAKSGVMIRESLDPGSKYVSLLITPTTVNGIVCQYRSATGGPTVQPSQRTGSSSTIPRYLRVARVGNVFTAYRSSNGSSWTTMSVITNAMSNTVYAGMALTSHDNSRMTTSTVASVNLILSGAVPAPSNLTASAGDGQAALSWSGASGATNHVVKRGTASGGPYASIGSTGAQLVFTDGSVTNGITYFYVVSSQSAAGESADCPQAAATPVGITPWLFTHLKFDETNGTMAADSAGGGRAGTLYNGAQWTAGHLANAVSLDGAGGYVALPAGSLSNLTACTIAAWVNLDTTTNWARVFDFGSGTTNYMFLTPRAGGTNVCRFGITTSGNGGEQRIDGNSALVTGAWTHVAVTMFGNVGILYLNGVEVGRNNAMTLKPANLVNAAQIWLGRSQWPADPYLHGELDDFRIYVGAMTAAALRDLAHPLIPPAAPSDLQATALSESQFRLSWVDNANNETKYVVARSRSGSNAWVVLANNLAANTTNGMDSGLLPLTAYDYRVHAENASGLSDYAMLLSAITPAGVGDGIPGAWRYQYFGNGLSTDELTCAMCDYDGDGQPNFSEYYSGTNPTNPASYLAASGADATNGLVVTWFSVPGKVYNVRWDVSPTGAWTSYRIVTGRTSSATTSFTDTNTTALKFFRIQVP